MKPNELIELIELLKLLTGSETKNESQGQGQGHPYKIGQAYFIRTVTHYFTGRLLEVTDKELVLTDAAWIADTGRWADMLTTGKLNEVEPFPTQPVIINRAALIDATEWNHKLPTEQQ